MNPELVVDPRDRLLEVLLEQVLRPEGGVVSAAAAASRGPMRTCRHSPAAR